MSITANHGFWIDLPQTGVDRGHSTAMLVKIGTPLPPSACIGQQLMITHLSTYSAEIYNSEWRRDPWIRDWLTSSVDLLTCAPVNRLSRLALQAKIPELSWVARGPLFVLLCQWKLRSLELEAYGLNRVMERVCSIRLDGLQH